MDLVCIIKEAVLYVACLSLTLVHEASAQNLAPEEFQKPFMRFDLTLKNPGKTNRLITKVGVRSEIKTGRFECLSLGGRALLPLADYTIFFHVADEETIIQADPPIEISPMSAARLTISLMPEATGSCGIWASYVSAIIIFDSGERVHSSPELITSADVKAFEERTARQGSTNKEILMRLQHRNPNIRGEALSVLSDSTIGRRSIELILQKKLDDPSALVRTIAARVTATMKFKSLTKKMASHLKDSQNEEEIKAYCEVLGELRDPASIDVLLSTIITKKVSRRGYDPSEAAAALVQLEHPSVRFKARTLLGKYISWTTVESDENEERYTDLCYIAIQYRDLESVPLIREAIKNCTMAQLNKIPEYILLQLIWLTRHRIINDPFILAMRPVAEMLRKHSDFTVRNWAIELLCGFPLKEEEIRAILLDGLNDSDSIVRRGTVEIADRFEYISLVKKEVELVLREMITYSGSFYEFERERAAKIASQYGYISFVSDILSLYKSSTEEYKRRIYCECLQRLKVPCPPN